MLASEAVVAAAQDDSRRPAGFKLPQIVGEAIARKGKKGWVLTFKLPRILRLIEVSCLVAVPEEIRDGSRSPVYIRFWLDRSQEDKPGSVVIE